MRHKVIIIGSGPSGYTAGIYTSRGRLDTLMFGGDKFGGQLMFTTEVENFPGFEEGILGPKLMMEMRKQMERFGATIINANVTKVDFSSRPFKVWQGEDLFEADSVIIATGAESMTLNLEREKDFVGKGISTCAVCDAAFYREKEVYVVGGGDSAIEDTMALTKFTDKVHLVVRRDELRASKIMQERILKNPKVKMLWNTEVKELIGEDKLTGLKIVNNKSGEEFEVSAEGLFYAIGHKPNSKFLEGAVKTDDKGYILTPLNGLEVDDSIYDVFMHKYMTMTSVPGVFAAGDVVDFRYKQAVTAAAYGCMSALDVERWLENNNSA